MKPVLIDLDITESLSPDERERFESRTGLVKAPVTIILPPEAGDSPKEALARARSIWPVSVLPGVGHNLLTIPTLGTILASHITKFLQG